jgi:hypothetical protein
MNPKLGRIAAVALACMMVLAATACAAEEPFGRLGVDDVAARLGKPGVYVYDNNSRETYASGHLPGSRWLDYDTVKAADLPKDKAATLVFYCANEH